MTRVLGRRAEVVEGDLTAAGTAGRVVEACRARLGRVDVLVNNAGDLIARRPLRELDEEFFRREELAPHGVRVNCVAPGLIGGTDFHGRFTAPDAFAAAARGVPLGRAGETVEVNGGLHMRRALGVLARRREAPVSPQRGPPGVLPAGRA